MPTVLRARGFQVVIFLPFREHGPAHVHVRSAAGEAIIELATGKAPPRVRQVYRMKPADLARAFWLVEEHQQYLSRQWKAYHG